MGHDDYSFIKLTITSDVNSSSVERRFRTDVSIFEFKTKLELITGCNHKRVKLEVYEKDGDFVMTLDDDYKRLADYSLQPGHRVHCVDPQAVAELKMAEKADIGKFEMSYEDYLKRPDEYCMHAHTIVAWMKRNQLGRFKPIDEEEKKRKENEIRKHLEEERKMIDAIDIGQRCELRLPEKPNTRGTVKYLGHVDGKKGFWIGIEFDEPVGDCDGTHASKQYFNCRAKYGGFFKPANVAVGDFPELGLDELDEF